MRTSRVVVLFVVILLSQLTVSPAHAAPLTIGYYDTSGEGLNVQADFITTSGNTPVKLFTLDAAELAGIQVLLVQDWFGSWVEYLSQMPAIETAVSNGMILIVYDATVTGASARLPGGGGVSFNYSITNDIDFINVATDPIANGPFGTLTDTSLDNGGSSAHGYADSGSLPADAVSHMVFSGQPNRVVTFTYPFGAGRVFYSTIPLGAYSVGAGGPPASTLAQTVLTPNLLAYGVTFFCASPCGDPETPTPTPFPTPETPTPTGFPIPQTVIPAGFPTPEPLTDCLLLDSGSNSIVRLSISNTLNATIYCDILNENGAYTGEPAEVGDMMLVEAGVLQAVEVFGFAEGGVTVTRFNQPVQVCLQGTGRLFFRDANGQPRVTSFLGGTSNGNYTCGSVSSAGTVVLTR